MLVSTMLQTVLLLNIVSNQISVNSFSTRQTPQPSLRLFLLISVCAQDLDRLTSQIVVSLYHKHYQCLPFLIHYQLLSPLLQQRVYLSLVGVSATRSLQVRPRTLLAHRFQVKQLSTRNLFDMYNTTTMRLQPNSTLLAHTCLLSFTLSFVFPLFCESCKER